MAVSWNRGAAREIVKLKKYNGIFLRCWIEFKCRLSKTCIQCSDKRLIEFKCRLSKTCIQCSDKNEIP